MVLVEFSELASGVGQKASDLAVLVVGNSSTGKFVGSVSSSARSTGQVTLGASILGEDDAIDICYLAFVSDDLSAASDSIFLFAIIWCAFVALMVTFFKYVL